MVGTRFALTISTIMAVAASVVLGAAAESKPEVFATEHGDVVIHPIHHATFVMEWNGATVYVDPVGGGGRFEAFRRPDLIVLTHVHGDHTSVETLITVTQEHTRIIAPASVAAELDDALPGELLPLAHGESFDHKGITVSALPAYNLTDDRLMYHPKERGDNSYVIAAGGIRIYVSGDTEDIPEMRSIEDIDVAFVCMNLPYTMTVQQAADAVLDFNPKIIYPYHYRGKAGASDLQAFATLVAANPDIDVRLIDWYAD